MLRRLQIAASPPSTSVRPDDLPGRTIVARDRHSTAEGPTTVRYPLGVNPRTVPMLFAAGRVAFGAGMLLAPRRVAHGWDRR
jgi:hypothetical protein